MDDDAGFGIYVHWPFCAAKCPYCDFNSHVRRTVDHGAWRAALVGDLTRQAEGLERLAVTSVFFGGGTPSLMEPATVAAILDRIADLFDMADGLEVTLEANPTSVEAGRFQGFHKAGVNRISMGIQSLVDEDLRRLGRMHSVAEAISAFDVARGLFDRVSFDLIYARQDQSVSAWEAELGRAVGMAVDHLSLYQLTIEDGTRFGDLAARGRLPGLPDEGPAGEMYEVTQAICGAAGLAAYEVSNHARPGAECRHNLTYWRYEPYMGIGPGAHGRLPRDGGWVATEAVRTPEVWCADPVAGLKCEPLEATERGQEMLLMSMRLSEGLDLARFEATAGRRLNPDRLCGLTDLGLVEVIGKRLRATEAGRMVLNAVIGELCEDWMAV